MKPRDNGPKDGGRHGDDDGTLFRRVVADAIPLKRRRKVAPVEPPEPRPTIPPKPPAKRVRPPRVPLAGPLPAPLPVAPVPAAADDRLAGIDRRTADRLRRGKLAIDARIDLHGMFQDDAHRALNGFVTGSAAAGRRVLLVITGKGRVREGGGVLRRNVPHWLRLAPCAPHVLAVVPAQPQHGGSGALYVMLRRKRD